MKTSASIALFSAASAAVAAPLQARHTAGDAFELTVTFSNSPLQGPLQANGGAFWIGKNASTYCPTSVGSACPPGTDTSFLTAGTGTLSLNTEVPGGQQVYISPEGLLTYTVAHSGDIPANSTTSGFVVNDSTDLFSSYFDFWLCNVAEDRSAYKIWLAYHDANGVYHQNGNDGNSTCTSVLLNAKDVADGPSAWEYD